MENMNPFVVKMVAAVFFISVCSETVVDFLSSNRRVLLGAVMIATLYIEKMLRSFLKTMKEEKSKTTTAGIVRENYELSRTVMNMSEQHQLLCEIRGSVARVALLSKQALQELRPRRFSESRIFQNSSMSESTRSLPINSLCKSRSLQMLPDLSDKDYETGGSAPVSPSRNPPPPL